MSLEMDMERVITCKVCGKSEQFNFRYQLKTDICSACAERVANLYWLEHSGEYLTWSNPGAKSKPPTRKSLPMKVRFAVWKRDGFHCVKCGSDSELTVDHIYPVSKGGSEDMDNFQTLCSFCNQRKGVKVEVAA